MSGVRVGNIALAVAIIVIVIYLIYGSLASENPLRKTKAFDFASDKNPRRVLQEVVNPLEVPLDQIMINLGKGDYRVLKATFSVEAHNEHEVSKIRANEEALRRIILNVASSEDGNKLATDKGKEEFKDKIINSARSSLGLNIRYLHFRNFVLAK
ncbi:MAG: flagellar basal body-associated FliL family protein [Sulfurospirillaceae bacterium]|jgi:flagellar basal body-associated protein FliL|nr:flagellar basal body-associated FliL family protein [Sulfurospirillaceae bacterium]NLM98690.1 hypothetical protein [Campylobacteraceae bacterium]